MSHFFTLLNTRSAMKPISCYLTNPSSLIPTVLGLMLTSAVQIAAQPEPAPAPVGAYQITRTSESNVDFFTTNYGIFGLDIINGRAGEPMADEGVDDSEEGIGLSRLYNSTGHDSLTVALLFAEGTQTIRDGTDNQNLIALSSYLQQRFDRGMRAVSSVREIGEIIRRLNLE